MKKFILSIILLFLALFPTGIFAQENRDCLRAWTSERYTCAGAYRKCYEECSATEGLAPESCYKACDNTSKACEKEVDANFEACKNASKRTPTTTETKEVRLSEPPATQETQLNKSEANTNKTKSKDDKEEQIQPIFEQFTKGVPVFIGGWFRAVADSLVFGEDVFELYKFADQATFGRDEREIAEENKDRETRRKVEWEQKQKQEQAEFEEFMNRLPVLTDEEVSQIRRNSQGSTVPSQTSGKNNSPYNLDILRGEAQIKLPGQNEWKALKAGDQILPGSNIFTGMDATVILSIEGKGVVQVQPFTEIRVDEKGLEQAAKSKQTYTDIKLDKGEVEVNIDKGIITVPVLQVQTPNATTSVRGTHFWVSYDKDKWLTSVGAYEGEVEFKTREGKILTITPVRDGSTRSVRNKPGVAVVVNKLSPTKLGITSLTSGVIIGGVILLLKKKFIAKGFKKK